MIRLSRESQTAATVAAIQGIENLRISNLNLPCYNIPFGLNVRFFGRDEEFKIEVFQHVIDVNLTGAMRVSQAAHPKLKASHGSIINIASMAGMTPLSRVVAYSAAKAAVINLTKFLAREWALRGVRVNAISPGFFPAEQNRAMLLKPDGGYTERGAQIVGHTPMGRFGEAHELAGAVVWLAARQASSFVTGQNIVVDGGFSAITI